jgi:hypothetical protein
MEFREYKPRKKPNYKRSLFLIILLLVVIYFWLNADDISQMFFGD